MEVFCLGSWQMHPPNRVGVLPPWAAPEFKVGRGGCRLCYSCKLEVVFESEK